MNSSIVRYRSTVRFSLQAVTIFVERKTSTSSYHADNKRCSGWRNNATKWPEKFAANTWLKNQGMFSILWNGFKPEFAGVSIVVVEMLLPLPESSEKNPFGGS